VLEREFCAKNNIHQIRLPVGPTRLTDEQLKTVIETINDPKCQPVLVHCEVGKARTGVVIGAYRIVSQGWTYEAAVAEARKFKPKFDDAYCAYLKELSEGKGWRPAPKSAVGVASRKAYP
jgi:protein tyrosine/serine phosphatase